MLRLKKHLGLQVFLVALFALSLGCTAAFADSTKAKDTDGAKWKFHTIVDAAFVQQYAKLPKPDGVMIIDARPYKAKYSKGYIPTAVSIPHSQFDKMVDKLPKDKSALLIYYCQSPA